MTVVYNHSLLLFKCDRKREAAKLWLQFRDVPLDHRPFWYETEMKKRSPLVGRYAMNFYCSLKAI